MKQMMKVALPAATKDGTQGIAAAVDITEAYKRFTDMDKDHDGCLDEYELRQFSLWIFKAYRDARGRPLTDDQIQEHVDSIAELIDESAAAHNWDRTAVGFVEFQRFFRRHQIKRARYRCAERRERTQR